MKHSIYTVLLLWIVKVQAHKSLKYQKPSKEILDLVDVPLVLSVFVDDNKDFNIFQYRDTFKSIEEISQEEMRLGGLRINPKTNVGSRVMY